MRGVLPCPLDLVDFGIDFHSKSVVELLTQRLELYLVSWDRRAAHQDHQSALQYPRPDLLFAEGFLLLEHLSLQIRVDCILLRRGL